MKRKNKSGICRISSFKGGFLLILLIATLLLVPQVLSKPTIQNKYVLGDKIKIDLPGQNVKVQIVTPSTSYLNLFSKSFLFEPKELGQYKLILGGEEYQFKVVEDSFVNDSLSSLNRSGNFSSVAPEVNYSTENSSFESLHQVVVGKPVRRNYSYSINGGSKFSVKIPSLAKNISVKVDGNLTKNIL